MVDIWIDTFPVQAQRRRRDGDQLSLGYRISAGEKRDLVAHLHELFCQVRDHAFGAAIEARGNALVKWCDLSDFQWSPLSYWRTAKTFIGRHVRETLAEFVCRFGMAEKEGWSRSVPVAPAQGRVFFSVNSSSSSEVSCEVSCKFESVMEQHMLDDNFRRCRFTIHPCP